MGIFVRDNLNPKIIKLPQNHTQPECLFLEVSVRNTKIAIGALYKPPKIPYGVFATVQENLAFVSTKYNHTIICGDFNTNLLETESRATKFLNLNVLEPRGFTNVVNKPTRITETTSTLLDLFLVSNTDSVKSVML